MAQIVFDEERAGKYAELLKAIGHPIRLRLVDILAAQGAKAVGDLADMLGVPQAIVSQQLRILRLNGLVAAERKSGNAFYQLAEENLRNLLKCLRTCRTL